MLPDSTVSSLPIVAEQQSPDYWTRDPTVSFNRKRNGEIWKCWFDKGKIVKAPLSNLKSVTTILTTPAVDELSIAFDQSDRDVVSMVLNKQLSIYWFSLRAGKFVTDVLGRYRCAILNLDERREYLSAYSDVVLLAMNSSNVVARYQRERFEIEHILCPRPQFAARIRSFGMNSQNRMQWSYHT